MEGVVSGIAGYGNCFGVPNLGGETKFEPCYSGNPLVNAFALGLVRKDEIFYGKAAGTGNPVIYVGAKTGRDGIHGATMASEEFKEGSEQKRPNVQVGDPFMEKLLLEACLEAMKTGAIVGIQDMGAAGLTCSTCEMGARGGVGLDVELDLVPQRETGMSAYEIMLSESQERMLLVAEKGREQEVIRVFEKWGLDAVIVGTVRPEPRLRIRHHGVLVADIPNQSLTDDAPLYHRPVGTWKAPVPVDPPEHVLAKLGEDRDYLSDLKQLLASANVCSKHWVHEQYDTMVQTNTVLGPGGEAGVMRIKGTGKLGTGTPGTGKPGTASEGVNEQGAGERGLAMALDGNGRWCYLDPKLGAMHAVAECARKVATTGATPVAATNCLNFGNPEKPEIMAQLSAAIDGIAEACTALGTPITGGNVSLYNETQWRRDLSDPRTRDRRDHGGCDPGGSGAFSARGGRDSPGLACPSRRTARPEPRSTVPARTHESVYRSRHGHGPCISRGSPGDRSCVGRHRRYRGASRDRIQSIWQFGVREGRSKQFMGHASGA